MMIKEYHYFRKCPAPAYEGLRCPYALSDSSPVPCFGSKTQCELWRQKVIEKGLWKNETTN
jgi:hypothetical protein